MAQSKVTIYLENGTAEPLQLSVELYVTDRQKLHQDWTAYVGKAPDAAIGGSYRFMDPDTAKSHYVALAFPRVIAITWHDET